MKLYYWTHFPSLRNLFQAFNASFRSGFFCSNANKRLTEEWCIWVNKIKPFIASAFWESLVNLRNFLPIRLALFKWSLKKERIAAQKENRVLNEYAFLLDYIGIETEYLISSASPSKCLNSAGPLLIIANHAYAPVDAISILKYVNDVREDFSILTNSNNPLLSMFAGHADRVIQLHSSTGPLALGDNSLVKHTRFSALRRTLECLKAGQCVIMFPAGEGSKALKWGSVISDVQWLDGLGFIVTRFIQKNWRLNILPIYIDGHMGNAKNSAIYQKAFLDQPSKLPAALQYALLNPPNKQRVFIGEIINARQFESLTNAQIVKELREIVYQMSDQPLPIAIDKVAS